ncbi:MAG: PP2C family protein-serine/threonine phosphatase [Planctomycetales bacterium]|nr:PP2C family protein-serine/threonine phosphatase [Planctomycetales bacterium]
MPPDPNPASLPEVLFEDKGVRLTRENRRGFAFYHAQGKATPELANRLRRLVSMRGRGPVALETADLTGVTAVLVGQIRALAREVEGRGDTFVLVRPGDRVRDLLALSGGEGEIKILASPEQLSDDLGALDARLRKLREVSRALAAEVSGNPLWRLRDSSGAWLCPLCASTCEAVRMPDTGTLATEVLDAAATHLLDACPPYRQGVRRPRPAADLHARLAQVDAGHRRVSKARTDSLESEVSTLRARAAESDRVQEGLARAQDRQARLLPTAPPTLHGIEFGLLFQPSARVSGDFYDFVRMDSTRLGIVVGDVSGHGIEGAILMGMAKKVIALRLRESAGPAEALARANADIQPDLDGVTFVSAMAAVLDVRTRQLTVARAGHNPALLVNPRRNPSWSEIAPQGLVLGMAEPERFKGLVVEESVPLEPGDLLLFYTDGVVECEDASGRELGLAGILPILEAHHAERPGQILARIRERLASYMGGPDRQKDDIAAIAMSVTA